MRRLVPFLAAALALATPVATAGAVEATGLPTATVSAAATSAPVLTTAVVATRLRTAVSGLPVAGERRAGYARSMFRLWTDADRDGCDTRAEVLISESRSKVRRASGCRVVSGRWVSYYDKRTWSKASALDIDHVVPLAEAWDSGARSWTADTRRRYANDLGDRRTLVAVTASVNRSKGDRDPAQWLPRAGRCT